MYCVNVFSYKHDSVIWFWWTDIANARILKRMLQLSCPRPDDFDITIDAAGSNYNLDNACGY